MERSNNLTAEDIGQLGEVFLPCLEKRDPKLSEAFCVNASNFLQSLATPEQISEKHEQDKVDISKPLSEAHLNYSLLQTELELHRIALEDPRQDLTHGRLPVIKGRIRVALSKPLPFYLRPLKIFAATEHPLIASLASQAQQAEKQPQIIETQIQTQVQELDRQRIEQQLQAEKSIQETGQTFYRFMESSVTTDVGLSRNYVNLLPHRVDVVLTALTRTQFASQPNTFANFIARELAEATTQRKALINRFPNLLSGKMNEQEINSLPEKIRNNWRNYLRDYLVSQLEEAI